MADSVGGLILAGGKGTRLGGINKALLEIGGRTNIERVRAALTPLCSELVVVANDSSLVGLPGLRVLFDREPHAGVLPALAQGLEALQTVLAVAVACDMPFLNPGLLERLVELATDRDVVIPVLEERPEPMHAVYRRAACLEAIQAALASGERRMISFLDRMRVERVDATVLARWDPSLRSFFNTNTPADLELARSIAAGEADS